MVRKIVIFAAYFLPYKGGYVESIFQLCRHLKKSGIQEIDVITNNICNAAPYEEIEGISIYRLPSWHILKNTFPIFKPSFCLFAILRTLYKKHPDLVLTQTRFFPISFLGFLFASIARIPYIHVERGACHSVVSNKIIVFFSHLYDHTFGSIIVYFARYNIGVSQASCDFLKHLQAKNIIKIYNGIDMPTFIHSVTKLHKKWHISENHFLITFVGRLIYAKGVQDLLIALSRIDTSFVLFIVGDGNFRKTLENLVSRLHLQSKVRFLGECKQSEVFEILSITDIFVNPSYSEGLPRSVLEACAVGLPIIATNVGGTPELIVHGKTGFLVESQNISQLTDSLDNMMSSDKLRTAMSRNARFHIAEHFRWPGIVQRYLHVFELTQI